MRLVAQSAGMDAGAQWQATEPGKRLARGQSAVVASEREATRARGAIDRLGKVVDRLDQQRGVRAGQAARFPHEHDVLRGEQALRQLAQNSASFNRPPLA